MTSVNTAGLPNEPWCWTDDTDTPHSDECGGLPKESYDV